MLVKTGFNNLPTFVTFAKEQSDGYNDGLHNVSNPIRYLQSKEYREGYQFGLADKKKNP